jgi:hypothetical protein
LTPPQVTAYTVPYMEQSSPAPKSRSLLYWGVAIATLIGGYADLARGGITLAPILLVLAYCVLIPLAILKR